MSNTDKTKRVALFVGVDKYDDESIPTLSGAISDARELHRFFKSHDQFDVAEVLENPTSDDVFRQVVKLSADLGEGDLFLFYFAGHGIADGDQQKLLCSNTLRGRRSLTNAFELSEVAGNEKWNVAVILDACRTRLDGARGMGARVGERRDIDFYDALVSGKGTGDASLTVLFSCDEGRTAGEVKGKRHGLFTLALLDVLERAARERRSWQFNQNLGDEIGKTMRRLADNDEGQRPWIKASGTPPLLFRPSMDVEPLIELADALRQKGLLSLDESGECQKAIGGNSQSPCAKGIVETLNFFSHWEEERQKAETPLEFAAGTIQALCRGGMAGGAGGTEGIQSAGGDGAEGDGAESGGAEGGGAKPLSRPLPGDARKRLRDAAEGVTDYWRQSDGRMARACEEMASAATEEDALAALRSVDEALRDAFIRENPADEEWRPLGRLRPLFSSKAWNALNMEVPDDSRCNCEADKALSRLFRLANSLCRILRN